MTLGIVTRQILGTKTSLPFHGLPPSVAGDEEVAVFWCRYHCLLSFSLPMLYLVFVLTNPVGIWNRTLSGFWMGSEIWKPNHLKTNQNGRHLVFTIWNPDFLVWISNGPVFQWLKPDHLKSDLQKVQISTSKYKMLAILVGFQMVGLPDIRSHLKSRPICKSTSFWPFEIQTSSDFRSPL